MTIFFRMSEQNFRPYSSFPRFQWFRCLYELAQLFYAFKIVLGKVIQVTAESLQYILLILYRNIQRWREFWLMQYLVLILPTRWRRQRHVFDFLSSTVEVYGSFKKKYCIVRVQSKTSKIQAISSVSEQFWATNVCVICFATNSPDVATRQSR